MALANTLFDANNIAGVAVRTTMVTAATIVGFRVFKLPPKWTAFMTALVVAYLTVAMKESPECYEWNLAFFNACLLFCNAFGLNELGAAISTPSKKFIQVKLPFKIHSWM